MKRLQCLLEILGPTPGQLQPFWGLMRPIVRKSVSVRPSFFIPFTFLLSLPFFKNMLPPHPLDTTHHRKIPDFMMAHWNQGD